MESEWEMDFNTNKCHVLEIVKWKKYVTCKYTLEIKIMIKACEERDSGTVMQDTLSPEKHIWEPIQIVNKYNVGSSQYGRGHDEVNNNDDKTKLEKKAIMSSLTIDNISVNQTEHKHQQVQSQVMNI